MHIDGKTWNASFPTVPLGHDKGSGSRHPRLRISASWLVAGSLLAGCVAAGEARPVDTPPATAMGNGRSPAREHPAPDDSHADGGGTARGRDATAVGHGAQASNDGASAFGGHAVAEKIAASAFGSNARAAETNATAVGANAQALGVTATALGANAQARANAATAVGYAATVREGAAGGIALGARSEVLVSHAVALGADSVADRAGTVSFGRAGATRQLVRIAAGTEATDAVNKAQLDALSTDIGETTHYFKAIGAHDGSDDALAYGSGATAAGRGSHAAAGGATAIGSDSLAGGFDSIALGRAAKAQAGSSMAIGSGAQVSGFGNTALGAYAMAEGEQSATALGLFSAAAGMGSTALGAGARADGEQGLALGFFAQGSGEESVAAGANSMAIGGFSIAMGSDANAQGNEAIAIGRLSSADGVGAFAAGAASSAGGTQSMAVGRGAQAGQDYGTALGATSYAYGSGATALGHGASALGEQSSALGYGSAALGVGDLAVGSSTARGKYSNAIGTGNVVDTFYATALGSSSRIERDSWNSVTIGHEVLILGDSPSSIAMGTGARIGPHAQASMALGFLASADGAQSIAIGGAGVADYGDDQASRHPAATKAARAIALGGAALAAADHATALGFGAYATAAGAVSLGANSIADRADTVSVGRGGHERQIAHVAAGTEATDAVNLQQLRQAVEIGGVGLAVQYDDGDRARITLKGMDGTALGNLKAGVVSNGSREAVNGAQLFEHGDRVAQMLGGGAAMMRAGISGPVYAIQGSRFYSVGDAFSAVDGKLGELDFRVNRLEGGQGIAERLDFKSRAMTEPVTQPREPGTASNLSAAAPEPALASSNASTPAIARKAAAGTPREDIAGSGPVQEALVTARQYADGAARQASSEARAYTDQRVAGLVTYADFEAFRSDANARFRTLDTRLNRVGAMGTALAGMAGAIAAASATNSRVSAAAGGYRGEAALAIGFAQRLPGNGAVLLAGSLAGGGESSGTLGMSFGW